MCVYRKAHCIYHLHPGTQTHPRYPRERNTFAGLWAGTSLSMQDWRLCLLKHEDFLSVTMKQEIVKNKVSWTAFTFTIFEVLHFRRPRNTLSVVDGTKKERLLQLRGQAPVRNVHLKHLLEWRNKATSMSSLSPNYSHEMSLGVQKMDGQTAEGEPEAFFSLYIFRCTINWAKGCLQSRESWVQNCLQYFPVCNSRHTPLLLCNGFYHLTNGGRKPDS